MKCRVCKGEAFIKLPAHNAAFCSEHFDAFFLRQITRTIKKYAMLPPAAHVVVALSGGKDSLTTALVLSRLGYKVEALFVDLGIDSGEFSFASRQACEEFCALHTIPLTVYDLRAEFSRGIPEIAKRYPRICALCGMTKRHIMNEYTLTVGAHALATGHTLDDMSASLFANLLRWDLHHLAKGLPVLPSEDGFAKKIKPLALQGEKEIRAFAQLHGLKPVEAVCPYAKEAKFKRYKAMLSELEEKSPGLKRAFYEGYTEQVHRFKEKTARPPRVTCAVCGLPAAASPCTFCRIWRNA
uniref:Adenine nucleotide alpha hydrolase family protein n=1 Tax=Ammonifex degensii TaxID=42838 RepID=A0A7C1J7S6_9THEO